MKKFSTFILSLVFLSVQCYAEVAVTVYNNNRALVKEVRDVSLKKGAQTLEFDNVASQIDPTSVLPKFLSDASKIKILEQNFDYDLVSTEKLLTKYIGKDIEIERTGEDKRSKLAGKLLSVSGGLVVQSSNKIVINPQGEISLSKLPENLRLKPTLVWLIDSELFGTKKMEVSYQTGGMSWNADYVLVTDEKDTKADITGWVTLHNNSGAEFKDAKLKLIAGDVNIVRPALSGRREVWDLKMDKTANIQSFQEKSFFEYHIYELQRKSTIKNNEIKQIEFITASNVPVKKVFTYNGAQNDTKVTVNLDFKNSKENNLGIPLPKGRIRVNKYDGDSMEFIGEDNIDHTAKDVKLSIYIGNAFDITGERKQTSYKNISSKSVEESYKITLKNSKNTTVEVNVVESMYRWNNWEITQKSDVFTKKDSRTVEFLVTVPANGEKEIAYTVKYWWK
ncbi:MAG: DUF4139 domain-containing protein [Endomicrobium sp.]|jgi:hypothetical protein|nr:DUF4139 domain-containing protein [Endomicrobium sp.]